MASVKESVTTTGIDISNSFALLTIKEEDAESEEDSEEESEEEPEINNKLVNIQIIECSGNKCRVHWRDGYGMHCESCYDEYDKYSDAPTDGKCLINEDLDVRWVECSGSKCRRCDIYDNRRICCSSCGCRIGDGFHWN